MPAADVVLLPLCIGLALLGVIATGLAWRRGNRGRVLQGVGLALAPVALYLAGLLTLLWNAVVAVVGWASRIIFSPPVWVGLGLLAVCVVLLVVGGLVARRAPKQRAVPAGRTADRPAVSGTATSRGAAGTATPRGGKRSAAAAQQAPVDEDMAEIEAILKNRGIQ